ncbi:hypothetical protein PG2011B_1342 [Bifidobacterium animalis subsp. lactis]|uniref:Uncharacterized protein n=1 Tax=Bifidobacterium animalis subsp. lactis TaxID=302911 RepID=A0A8B3RGV7_BIFAN|nr:hypothetical protein PG2011B_1342 [Bifidobacterium animalis subsp. lactis]
MTASTMTSMAAGTIHVLPRPRNMRRGENLCMLLRGDSVMSPHFRTAQAMAGCADMLRSARTMLTRTHTCA